jgi:hypothetical protein
MTQGMRGRLSMDEISGSPDMLHCSCGTSFQRPEAASISSRHLWKGDDAPAASSARSHEMGSSETVRARCPGCGTIQNFERSGSPVSY